MEWQAVPAKSVEFEAVLGEEGRLVVPANSA